MAPTHQLALCLTCLWVHLVLGADTNDAQKQVISTANNAAGTTLPAVAESFVPGSGIPRLIHQVFLSGKPETLQYFMNHMAMQEHSFCGENARRAPGLHSMQVLASGMQVRMRFKLKKEHPPASSDGTGEGPARCVVSAASESLHSMSDTGSTFNARE